jgi:hypothetical protein
LATRFAGKFPVDFGLLGMDFLHRAKAQIDVVHGEIITEAKE